MGDRPDPSPGPGEVLLSVLACGVCRTDLHLAEGDLRPHGSRRIPGHEVVGEVTGSGAGSSRFRLGDRVGAAWLARTCGSCRFCHRGSENLCLAPTFTGWDTDGGYAELMTEVFANEHAAPLMCAGIIGYRALRSSGLPQGGKLGIYGFDGSAHLTAQMAIYEGASVYVMTRSVAAQRLALELGAQFAGAADAQPPELLDAAILFAPAGGLVPVALRALDRGGTLAVAGIHLSNIPVLDYQKDLFQERHLRSVTANTRADGQEFLALAEKIPLRPTTVSYPWSRADQALLDLSRDHFTGAAVLLRPA
ncbi:zinc-binding alcohol dehydrogenase family protein [Pseudarthrobacter cellobiosi]|uniref:zinc-binding alcohol dehydrogenase family protein n=1 Tax=Pseudarthrobacter cellobiosi TaxID=2953654 RepID=UPI0027E39CFF|nr:zinc-binding alcohol dehydrogenase family protein [Pseudarthrobacter sp. HLT1-5]